VKDFKSFSFLKNSSLENQELLTSPKLEELLFHQWENYQSIKTKELTPDFNSIYSGIEKKAFVDSTLLPEYTLSQNTTKTTLGKSTSKSNFFSLKWYLSVAAILSGFLIGGNYLARFYGINFFTRAQSIVVSADKGQRTVCSLPDGTKVWLNSDSKLEYPKQFSKKCRRVKLTGEAYFDVVKNPKQPFIVEASFISIKVLGTKFNVKSYPKEKTIETTLESGSVSLQKIDAKHNSTPVIIKPQQKATFSIDHQDFKLESVNSELLTSWKDGKLIFDNELINEVALKIERHYGLKVNVSNCKPDDRITLTVKEETIEEVLRLIQLTTPVNFTVENFDGTGKRTFIYRNDQKLFPPR
jgi:ferric-dicitrate binding protein FerR (iron transport regulator)